MRSPPADADPDLDDDALDEALARAQGAPGADRDAGEVLHARVPDALAAQRIDRVAAALFDTHSRARIQAWIEAGRLRVDGAVAHAKTRLYGGERLDLAAEADPEATAFAPEPVPLAVLHEDDHVIVIDKPAGLVVHPAAGHWHGTLLNGLLHRWPTLAAVPRAGIVHRLDKDTSGLLVVARTLEAQTALVRQLQARSVRREYLAVAHGRVSDMTIDAPIGRDPRDRVRMAVTGSGKPAVTHVRLLAEGRLDAAVVSAIACRLQTGRTHQIRVHLAARGHALVGDVVYAPRARVAQEARVFTRQALHARTLAFDHPADGTRATFRSAMPSDLVALLAHAGLPADLPDFPDRS